jgi:LmbE family N-acetylglucosaminyl deacetylase
MSRRPSLAGAALLLVAVAARAGSDAPPVSSLRIPPGARVMVFAPHPDDETLAAGGLLARLVRSGHAVRVVFFTNGDGFPEAVTALAHGAPRAADYVAYGRRREAEATAALRRLGVPGGAVRFLGFPDGGLAELWRTDWARPYRSPFTGTDRPPYQHVIRPRAAYEGTDLTALVAAELRSFRPTVVVLPHPADQHPDHAHAGMFVVEAVAELQERGALPARLTTLGYLVHYPDWPHRKPPGLDRVLPVPGLAHTSWMSFELTAAERMTKRRALGAYRTQLTVMRGYLETFVTRNELFAALDPVLVADIAAVH